MRTILMATILSFAMAGGVMAGTDYIDIGPLTGVGTNSSGTTITNTSRLVSGYVDAVMLDLSGVEATPTVNVSVVTSGYLPSRTILSTNSVLSDFTIYVRSPTRDTTGLASTAGEARIPLVQEALKVSVHSTAARATGVNARVYILYSDLP